MSKKKKKNKGKKAHYKGYWREIKPHQINQVAKDVFGGKYYCIGDNSERKQDN